MKIKTRRVNYTNVNGDLIYHCQINAERASHYRKFENELIFGEISFQIEEKDIPKIEKMNNSAVNVFSNEDNSIIPIYISKTMKEVQLLIYT
uniref:Uncharacterized protein n=1 Tax=Heterorhabditis bacteriophora TaxID=37862 RepID=A0A1I7W6H9_HETBA